VGHKYEGSKTKGSHPLKAFTRLVVDQHSAHPRRFVRQPSALVVPLVVDC
jgi:hypothetical protein